MHKRNRKENPLCRTRGETLLFSLQEGDWPASQPTPLPAGTPYLPLGGGGGSTLVLLDLLGLMDF